MCGGFFPKWWCHSLPMIDICWFIFSVLPVWQVFDSWSLLHWHEVIQLAEYNRSQTQGQEEWVFFWYAGNVVGRTLKDTNTKAAFLLLDPGSFSLWCDEVKNRVQICAWTQGRGNDNTYQSLTDIQNFEPCMVWVWPIAHLEILNLLSWNFLLPQPLVDPATMQNSWWPSATVTLVGGMYFIISTSLQYQQNPSWLTLIIFNICRILFFFPH